MARYIDADELICLIEIEALCEGNNFSKRDVKRCIRAINTADVVPKSEVERLQAEINAYSIAKKYDAEHFMADIKTLQTENATLIKNRDKLLQIYSRKIFEEIEKILNESRQGEYSKEFGFLNRVSYNGYVLSKGLAELKKKYTEGEK